MHHLLCVTAKISRASQCLLPLDGGTDRIILLQVTSFCKFIPEPAFQALMMTPIVNVKLTQPFIAACLILVPLLGNCVNANWRLAIRKTCECHTIAPLAIKAITMGHSRNATKLVMKNVAHGLVQY